MEDDFAWFAFPAGLDRKSVATGVVSDSDTARQWSQQSGDALQKAIAGAFLEAENGPETDAPVAEPLMDDAFETPEYSRQEYLGHLNRLGLREPKHASGSASSAIEATHRSMSGTVTVALVFVESDGTIDPDIYSWTQADQAATVAGVTSALAWWAEQALNRGVELSFRVVVIPSSDPRAQQGYEPMLHPGTEESLWIRAIMANMNLAGDPYAAVTAFNTSLNAHYHSNRTFTAFFSYNPLPAPAQFSNGYAAWAFLNGPYTSLLFRSFGWSTMQVFAHETGHIFGACDEHFTKGYGGCRSCGPCGGGPENGNCMFCNPDWVPCMMRLNERTVCPFTARQLGWPELPEQCFEVHNEGNQTLTVDSIEHPSWIEVSPTLPIAIAGGASKSVCGAVHCNACENGPLVGSLAIHGNDTDEVPVISVYADCTCATAKFSCRCANSSFQCEVYTSDSSRNGELATIEINHVRYTSRIIKNTAHFTGAIGQGEHRAVLVSPNCPTVSHPISCSVP